MEKIIKVLKDINKKENLIKDELKTNKNNSKNSNIINNILIREYPKFSNSNSTKDLIFNIFNELLQRASRKYSRTWKQLFENLDKLLKILYKNPLTLRGILSELRKSLKNERFEPLIYEESIKLMGMSIQESKNIAEKYKNEVQARNVNRGDLPVIYIEDIYNLLDQLIQSNNPYELSIAVEISTGARSIEVFKVSKFEEVEDHPNQIRVIGLAKDKNANNLENVVLVRNLVHLKANQVINAVNKISVMYDRVVNAYKKWKFRKLRAEVVQAQGMIVSQFKDYMRTQNILFTIEEYHPPRNMKKAERISAILEPRYSNKLVWHYKGGNCQILEEELLMSNPEHDDIKDALASVVEIAKPPMAANKTWRRNNDKVIYSSRFGGVAS